MFSHFFQYTRAQLGSLLGDKLGFPALHADTLYKQIYRHNSEKLILRDHLPTQLVANLPSILEVRNPVIAAKVKISAYDQSVKFLSKMQDGALVETVLMPEKNRLTVCLSSQVGCAQACVFCHTGRMGLKRNLEAKEIVGQLVLVNRWLAKNPDWLSNLHFSENARVSNIVFMGMGEPLDNVSEIIQALKILTDPMGLAIAQRKISVSTAGHLDGLKRLLEVFPNVPIALSLHGTTDAERSKLLPINKRFPILEVLSFLKDNYCSRGKSVLMQYTVISGVNDSEQHARRLLNLLEGLKVKVNLIPLNEVEKMRLKAPNAESLQNFRDILHLAGKRVMIRYSKGQDIEAACGQLVSSN